MAFVQFVYSLGCHGSLDDCNGLNGDFVTESFSFTVCNEDTSSALSIGRLSNHNGLTNNAWTEDYTLHTQLFRLFDNGAISLDRAVHLSFHSYSLSCRCNVP